MGNSFVLDLELGLNVDKSKIGQSLSKILSSLQKDADGNKIELGADFKKDILRDLGKQFASFTKGLKPAELDNLFNDEKIKNEVLEIINSIETLENKIKELSSVGSVDSTKLKRFNETDIRRRIQDQFDLIESLYNDDYELDFKYKTDLDAQYAKKESQELFDEINSILREYDGAEKIKDILKSDIWWSDLKKIGEHFDLKLNFEPFKQDNSQLEALTKERDQLFERLSGKYMQWTNTNFESIMSKMTSEIELVPKISDSFKADAEKLIEGLDLKAEVNLIGKIGENGFIDAEQLEQVLEGITQAFSNMQKDGKFSLDLIDKEQIDEIKNGIKELNNFTDLLKTKKTTQQLVSDGALLRAFNEENNRQNIFSTFEKIVKDNKNTLDEDSVVLGIEDPKTGEIYTSYNDMILLLKDLATEYELTGEKARAFNSYIEQASFGMKEYDSLEMAWYELSDHITNVIGQPAYASYTTGEYYKELEETSTVFNTIEEKLSRSTSIISSGLDGIVEKLEEINNKNFNVTIDAMNNLNSATENTVKNVSQLGTVLRMIADADKIIRELQFAPGEDERVGRERALLYNSSTGKMSNPFVWDSEGHVGCDTYRKLGFEVNGGMQNMFDTMVHSHSGDDVVIPSMRSKKPGKSIGGDMAVAVERYFGEGIKNQIIVATDEIMHLNMDAARKAFGNLDEDDFTKAWTTFVEEMQDTTNLYAHQYLNYDELKYLANFGELNYEDGFAFYSDQDEEVRKHLTNVLSQYDVKTKDFNKYYNAFEDVIRSLDGEEINRDTSLKLKDKLINAFTKISGNFDISEDIAADFNQTFLAPLISNYIKKIRNFSYGDDQTEEGRKKRNYWLRARRPGIDKAIEMYGLQDAFNFYSPEEFEKEFNINFGENNLNEINEYLEILQKIIESLDEIKSKSNIDIDFGSNLEFIEDVLDGMSKSAQELSDFINKINFNGITYTGSKETNPLFNYIENTDKKDIEKAITDNIYGNLALHKPFEKAIGFDKDQLNNSLKEYFNGFNVTYESMVSLIESIGKYNGLIGINNFDIPLNKLKSATDYIKTGQFSYEDLEAFKDVNNVLLDSGLTSVFNLDSYNGFNLSTPKYEIKNGTIFDQILESIEKIQNISGTINFDNLDLSKLDLSSIITDLNNKNQLFEDEEGIVKQSVEHEIESLKELESEIDSLIEYIKRIPIEFSTSFSDGTIEEFITNLDSSMRGFINSTDKKDLFNIGTIDFDITKIEKFKDALKEIKENIDLLKDNIEKLNDLNKILDGLKFDNLKPDELKNFVDTFNEFKDAVNSLTLDDNSFIPKLKSQLDELILLIPQLETLSKYIKEIKDNSDVIGDIDNDSGGSENSGSGGRKKKKLKDDSETGKKLDQYENAINSYYKTLSKIALGTATNKDVVINTTAQQEMVRLEEELANNTVKTNEQQQRFADLVNQSKAAMEELNNSSSNIANILFANSNIDTSSNAFTHIEERYNELQNKLGNISDVEGLKQFREELDLLTSDYLAFEKLYSKSNNVKTFDSYSDALEEVKRNALEYGKIIKENADIQPDGSGMAKYTVTVKAATGETKRLSMIWNESIKSMALSEKFLGDQKRFGLLGFFDNVKKKIYDVTSYLAGVYLSPMDWIRYIREGFEYVKNMDTALTEMRKVSDESLESLKRYQMQTFDTARTIGTTATELQNSTADWMRLGESLDEASKSAETTAILSNVSEFESIDKATEALVAVSQAYTDLDKMSIVDKLNEVGNNYSISTDELATGLQRSSSTLMLMGNTIDEAAALITAGNATIQNAESVAAGVKTISLRIVGTKEAEEELKVSGEDVEDAFIQMTSSKKQQIIKDYTAVASNNYEGFDILDENGNYKNTYEILLGISKVYKEIQEEDKKFGTNRASALIEELAGKNRSNIVSAILSNGEMLEAVRASSEEASGSALRENEKYLDSIEGRVAQLRTGVEEFWNKAMNSEDLKTIISLLTNALNVVNELIGNIGSIPSLLAVSTPLWANKAGLDLFSYGVLKDENGDPIKDENNKNQYGFQGLVHDLFAGNNIADEFDDIAEAEERASVQAGGFRNSLSSLSSGFSVLSNIGKTLIATLGEIAISMAIAFAATQIFKFIDHLINGNKQLIESGKTAAETISNTYDSYNEKVTSLKSSSQALSNDEKEINSLSESLENLGSKYVELSNGVSSFDNSNISLTNEEYQTFLDTSNEIAKVLPELVDKYDSNGNAMLNLGSNAEEASEKIDEALAKHQQLSHYDIMKNTVDQMLGISEQSRLYGRDKRASDQNIKDIEENIKSVENGRVAITMTEEDRIARLNELYRELNEEKQNNAALDTLIEENYKSFIPTLQDMLNTTADFTNLDETIQEKVLGQVNNLTGNQVEKILADANGDSVKLSAYLDSVFVQPFQELEERGMTDRLTTLFDFDNTKMTLQEYKDYINDELMTIFSTDKSQVPVWKSILGLDDLKEQQKRIDNILSDTTDDLKVTKEQFDSLTMEDRNIAYDLIVNDKFEGTFSELKKRIKETKAELNEQDLFGTPLLDKYNEAVKEVSDNGGDVGKNFDAYGAALKSLKEQYDKGLVGTDTFKNGARMFSIGGSTDADNFIENYKRISKWFNDEDPAKGINKFLKDMEKLSLVKFNKDGSFVTTFDDVREGAEKAKVPLELFVSMFDKIEEFGGYNDFFATKGEGFETVGEITGELAAARAEYEKLLDTQPKNKSAIKAKEEEIKSLEDRLKAAQKTLKDFVNGNTIKEYTENYKAQRKAAQDTLKGLNDSKNFKKATDDEKKVMLEAIKSGFENSGLDSSVYKNLGINKNGRIVLDVNASNKRIDNVLDLYDNGNGDVNKKLKEYGGRTVGQVVEMYAKEMGLSVEDYIKQMTGDLGIVDAQEATNDPTVENNEAIANNTSALEANTNALLGKDPEKEKKEKEKRDKEKREQQERKNEEKGPRQSEEEKRERKKLDRKENVTEERRKQKQEEKSKEKSIEKKEKKEQKEPINQKYDEEGYRKGKKKLQEKITDEKKRQQSEKKVDDKNLGQPDKRKTKEFIDATIEAATQEIKNKQYGKKQEQIESINPSGTSQYESVTRKRGKVVDENNNENYFADIKEYTNLEGEIKYTAIVDGVEKDVEKVTEEDGYITYHFKTDGEKDPTKGKKQNKDGGTITSKFDADTSPFDKKRNQVEKKLKELNGAKSNPYISISGADKAKNDLRSLENTMNRLNGKNSKVTLTTVKEFITKTTKQYNTGRGQQKGADGHGFNGTFHVASAYASGTTSSNNVSIQKDETALINELGKEMIVRDGKALTFNSGYPTFANLKKGDVVFNHKQTEELEKKGYVTGSHAKLYGTSAFVSGTVDDEDEFEELSNAYKDATTNRAGAPKITSHTTTKKKTTKKSSSNKKSSSSSKKKSSSSSKKKNSNSSSKKWENFEKWLGQLFDWVEIRLDDLSRKTEAWTTLFEKFLNAASANATSAYNAAISAARNEQTYSTTASNRYLQEALIVGEKGAKAAGYKQSWVMKTYKRLMNGDIEETEIKKMSEKQQSLVSSMKDYIDKARDAANSTIELTDSINDLIKAQRDAKVEFKKSAFTSAVESDSGYLASTKNNVLSGSTAVANYSIGIYDKALQQQYTQLSNMQTSTVKASKSNTAINKKILDKLSKKGQTTYKKNLTAAKNSINSKKAISSSLINYFQKINPSLAAKYLAWNTQLAYLENARMETADNFAENMKTIMNNIAESYSNLDEETQSAIDYAQSQAENMSNYEDANKILDKLYGYQDTILKNDQAEINRFAGIAKGYSNQILNTSYKGGMYNNAAASTKNTITNLINKVKNAVNSGKAIDSSTMLSLYDYFTKGYISQAFYQACVNWNESVGRVEQAVAQKLIDEETAKQEKLSAFSSKVSNINDYFDSRVDELEARKASINGSYDDTVTQDSIIQLRIREYEELEKAFNDAMDAKVIEKGDKAWYEYKIKIQEAKNEVNELKETQFETVLAEKFDRAIEKAQEFIDKLDTINDLIEEEMLFEKDSGKLTETGWLSLGLNSQALAKEQNNLEKYFAKRQEILKAYEEGNKSYFGDQSFDEMINENAKDILSTIQNMNSSRGEILSIIEGQADAELEALQKVIDKRKEALQKKQDYYSWDKTIKGKTKDLQALEQQIRALEGVSGQEAAAKRANLMAQRQEMQEDLDDTVKEHIYDLQVTDLDEMMDGLQEDLDEWKKNLHSDIEFQTKTINDAIAGIGNRADADSIAGLLSSISEKSISAEDVVSILHEASKTMSDENTINVDNNFNGKNVDGTSTTIPNASNNVDTSSGGKALEDDVRTTETKELVEAVTDGTVEAVKNATATDVNVNVIPTTTTKKAATAAATTKKQTVTNAQAQAAAKYIFDHLIVSKTQNTKGWGQLNLDLWRHSKDKNGNMIDRRVYLPLAHEKGAWKKLGFAEKDFSVAKLYAALKSSGIWAEMLKVRTPNLKYTDRNVKLSNIKGYAKGGTVHKSGQYLTDEKGEEIIITKQGILRPLSAGTSVIPADITEKLYAIASNYDVNSRVPSINLSNLQRVGGETISPIINCPITIEGNANEQDVINAINKTLPKISKHVQNDIRKDLRKSGR